MEQNTNKRRSVAYFPMEIGVASRGHDGLFHRHQLRFFNTRRMVQQYVLNAYFNR